MTLVYFESEHGVVALDAARIVGARQRRTPTNYPTGVLLDCAPFEVIVRNGFDDVQRRLIAAGATAKAEKES